MTQEEIKWRQLCSFYYKRGKGKNGNGVCLGNPSAHYSDTPCYVTDDCFWMKEWRKLNSHEDH